MHLHGDKVRNWQGFCGCSIKKGERGTLAQMVLHNRTKIVRPEKWDDSQVGFRGGNASGGRLVLLPGAFWAHGASKMATLGASLPPRILQCFGA